MIFYPAKMVARHLTAPLFYLLIASRLLAAPTGPTLHFNYGHGNQPDNPLEKFMYFVPLISPEPVTVFTNAGNTQCARVISFHCQTNGESFQATCEFEMIGTGVQRNVFDHTAAIRRHDQDFKAGKPLAHQLASINVEGAGSGSVEIEGVFTNDAPVVSIVRLRFNGRGRSSPVTISLEDLGYANGAIHPENEMVARVNELTFLLKAGKPQMEVSLASVKAKGAGDSLWQNLVGGIKGMAANLLIPPLTVTADGHQAMMDFGLALALGQPEFTFPFATRLEGRQTIEP